jgi:tetratricopeptide (TPR) repeat protein
VRRFPNSAAAHFQLAYALGDNSLYAEGLAAFERARQLDPAYPHVDAQISWTYTQLGEHNKAIEAARRAVAREPNYSFAYQQLGESLYTGGKHEEALEAFQKNLALAPSDAWAYKRLADVYHTLDRYPEGFAVLMDAVERFPSDLVLAIDYGTSLLKNGEPEMGRRQLERAEAIAAEKLAETPSDVALMNNLGVTQEYQGKLDAALATYSRVLKSAPENSSDYTLALSNIASTHMKARRYSDAVTNFRRAFELSKNPGDQRMIVLSLFCAGQPAEALAEADKWFAANPSASHSGRYMGIHACTIAGFVPGADAAKYVAHAQALKDDKWPAPCVDYLAGKLSDQELLATDDNDKQTEARAYIGFKQVAAKNNAGLEHLKWVRDNGNRYYTETDQAIAYLLRNGK